MKDNRGWNRFFYLPLILGLIGLAFQAVRDPKGASVVGLLFLMTGIAIVVYLNQTPFQPRERDYAYVGSFCVCHVDRFGRDGAVSSRVKAT